MRLIFFLIPLFLIRYGLIAIVNKDALPRAAHFAPMQGVEQIAYVFYQVSTLAIIIYSFFLRVSVSDVTFPIALGVYILGIILYAISSASFARARLGELKTDGIYRFSRNPMYVSQFLYFLGIALLSYDGLMLIFVIVFQVSAHWIILAEERWCKETYGEEYLEYMEKTRRYI